MTYDYELTLVDIVYSENDMGDPVEIESRLVVLCDVQSITRSEFYQADASGLKPSIVFVLNKYDYSNQKKVVFEGDDYKVIRRYEQKKSKGLEDFESIELICEGVVNHGNA